MILDVCAALAPLLDPDTPAVVLDIEPLTWEAGNLYVYPLTVDEIAFETAQSRRQEFALMAVRVYSNDGEEALSKRNPDLAVELDSKRGDYLAAVRHNQAALPDLWGMITGRVDSTEPRTLTNRSAAIRISGWRIIGG